ASAPAYTVRYPRSRVFHRTTVCTTPACTYGLLMFGSDNPITRTSDRPAWRTASAAPGTAGAEIAIISFTDGYTLRMVWVSANALSRSSSLGRMTASFTP